MARLPFDLDTPRTATEWILFAAGMGIALTSPMAPRMIIKEIKRYLNDKQQEKLDEIKNTTLSQAIYLLKKRRVIKITSHEGKTVLTLTEKGKKKQLAYEFKSLQIPRPPSWDGKWRTIMFDIPHRQKAYREILREKLKKMGFKLFQKSIWIHPHPCGDQIDFIAELLGIGKHINLFTIQIDEDQDLREKFELLLNVKK